MSEEKTYEKQTVVETSTDKIPDVAPGKYTITKAGINVGFGDNKESTNYQILSHLLIKDDPLLKEHGTLDPIARQDHQAGDKVFVVSWGETDENSTAMMTEESFFFLNDSFTLDDFKPIEEK